MPPTPTIRARWHDHPERGFYFGTFFADRELIAAVKVIAVPLAADVMVAKPRVRYAVEDLMSNNGRCAIECTCSTLAGARRLAMLEAVRVWRLRREKAK